MSRLAHGLVLTLRAIALVGLFLMMALTFVDVVGRYFGSPIFGAAEMIQFLLAITVFAAMGLASASGSHISVDILEAALDRVAPRARRLLVWTTNVLTFGLIVWQLGELALDAAATERRSIVLEWPQSWVIGICALLVLAAFVVEMVGHHDEHADDDTPEERI